MMEFKDFLISRRNALGYSQNDIASAVGYSAQLVSLWEQGKAFPDLSVWGKLCQILNVDLENFLYARDYKVNKICDIYKFDANRFANNLKYLRKTNNLTQLDLAKMLEVNVKTVASREKGTSLPQLSTFLHLCSTYEYKVEELYFCLPHKDEANKKPIKKKRVFLPIFLPIVIVISLGAATTTGVVTTIQRRQKTMPIENKTENSILYDEHYHWYVNEKGEISQKEEHVLKETVIVEVSCGYEGKVLYACEKCPYHYHETVEPTGEHIFDEGYTFDDMGHWKECAICDYTSEFEAHQFIEISYTEPTYVNEGNYEYQCEICGYQYIEVIPALEPENP